MSPYTRSCVSSMMRKGAREMPLYFFNVRDGSGGFADREGTELPDALSARTYAQGLAREVMRANESRKRHWHVVVCDSDGKELFDLPFAAIDDSLRHLNADSRRLIEVMCEKRMA